MGVYNCVAAAVSRNVLLYAFVRKTARKFSRVFPHEPEIRFLLGRLDKGGVFIDVGANDGITANAVVRRFDQCVSFEPGREHHRLLKDLQNRNPGKLVFHAVALSDKSLNQELFTPRLLGVQLTAFSSLDKEAATRNLVEFFKIRKIENYVRFEKESVEVRTLDSFELSAEVIKVDVEGLELEVIRGAIQTISSSLPCIVIEHRHQVFGTICGVLSDFGYAPFFMKSGLLAPAKDAQAGLNCVFLSGESSIHQRLFPELLLRSANE